MAAWVTIATQEIRYIPPNAAGTAYRVVAVIAAPCAVKFPILYTDNDTSVVKSMPGTIVSGVNTNATNSTSTRTISGCFIANAKASTNIQYQMDYTSSGATPMQYNLHIKLGSL